MSGKGKIYLHLIYGPEWTRTHAKVKNDLKRKQAICMHLERVRQTRLDRTGMREGEAPERRKIKYFFTKIFTRSRVYLTVNAHQHLAILLEK